jgi:2'-5' RNA ligase
VDWPVREYLLVRSRLSAEGPRYDVVERFPLG